MKKRLFSLALYILTANSVTSVLNFQSIKRDTEWVIHTHEVRQNIAAVLADVTDIETGVRGYVASGGVEGFLESHVQGVFSIDKDLDRFVKLTVDNPRQQKTAKDIRGHIDRKVDISKSLIDEACEGEKVDVETLKEGKREMDAVRKQVGVMQNEEDRLLKTRVANLKYAYAWMVLNTTVFVLLSMAGLTYTVWALKTDRLRQPGL